MNGYGRFPFPSLYLPPTRPVKQGVKIQELSTFETGNNFPTYHSTRLPYHSSLSDTTLPVLPWPSKMKTFDLIITCRYLRHMRGRTYTSACILGANIKVLDSDSIAGVPEDFHSMAVLAMSLSLRWSLTPIICWSSWV